MGALSTFYKNQCIYLPAMAGWFVCSAGLSSYNKVVFGENRGAFPCPLLLTSIHFLVQWIFSFTSSQMYPEYFGADVVKNMSWKTYIGISVPCGLVTAFDVGLSNMSLVRISITFFTMVKSSAPIWVLLSAFTFGLEKITLNLIMVGVLITAGEILTAFGEVEFDTVGFCLCLSAAICGGIRWTLVQFKLQKLDPPLGGPVVTMRVLASTMFFSMLMLSAIIERPWEKLGPEHGDPKFVSLGLFGAFIAIAMVLCEFWLILNSTAIILMIGGVLKELLTIFVGVAFFGDDLNIINVSGIVVVFFGVFLYKVTLHLSKAEKEVDAGETDSVFSRVSSLDAYDDEMPRRHKHKNSNPDLALSYTIDDEDDDDEEEEDVMDRGNLASPLRRTNGSREAFEMGDVEVPPVV